MMWTSRRASPVLCWRQIRRARIFLKRMARVAARSANHAVLLPRRPVRQFRLITGPPKLVQFRLEAVQHPYHPLPSIEKEAKTAGPTLLTVSTTERLPIYGSVLEEIDAPPLGWGAVQEEVSPTACVPAPSAVSAAMTDLPRHTIDRLIQRSPAPSRRSRIRIQRQPYRTCDTASF